MDRVPGHEDAHDAGGVSDAGQDAQALRRRTPTTMQTMMMIRSSNSDNPAVSIDSDKRKRITFLSICILKNELMTLKKHKGK